jgi:hypothetical protein
MDAGPKPGLYQPRLGWERQHCMRHSANQNWTWGLALAVLGVLMHTGLLVRHAVHATQLSASDIAIIICQGNGQSPINARLPQPDDPLGPQHVSCPDCTAATNGQVILPSGANVHVRAAEAETFLAPHSITYTLIRAELPPPGRGPPVRTT